MYTNSNLPPGCSDADIERAAGAYDSEPIGPVEQELDAQEQAAREPVDNIAQIFLHVQSLPTAPVTRYATGSIHANLGPASLFIWNDADARRLARAILAVTDPEGA